MALGRKRKQNYKKGEQEGKKRERFFKK